MKILHRIAYKEPSPKVAIERRKRHVLSFMGNHQISSMKEKWTSGRVKGAREGGYDKLQSILDSFSPTNAEIYLNMIWNYRQHV